MKKPVGVLFFSLAVCGFAYCQSDLLPAGQYPQFRTLSGLPGGGFGVMPDGSPSIDGALTFSTPIGYSLTDWHFSGTLSNTSDNLLFKLPHVSGRTGRADSLGKASLMLGVPLGKFGSATASVMVVSSVGDRAENFQYELPFHPAKLGVSVGVQDIVGHRGTGAEGFPNANGISRSYFVAATLPLRKGFYASAGYGDRRFEKGFASISGPVAPRVRAFIEHDGFNFNFGVAYAPKIFKDWSILGRQAKTTLMVGMVRAKYAFWSVNVSF